MISKGAQYIFCVVLICAVDLKIGVIFDMVCVFLYYLVAMLFGEKCAFS